MKPPQRWESKLRPRNRNQSNPGSYSRRCSKKTPEHYAEIGSDPKLTKEAIVGQLYKLAERLANDREDYKAADSLLNLAKVQGGIGVEPDSLWATFSKLSQADIDKVKERLKAQIAGNHEKAPVPTADADQSEVKFATN